jgi:hypothetical protein
MVIVLPILDKYVKIYERCYIILSDKNGIVLEEHVKGKLKK